MGEVWSMNYLMMEKKKNYTILKKLGDKKFRKKKNVDDLCRLYTLLTVLANTDNS